MWTLVLVCLTATGHVCGSTSLPGIPSEELCEEIKEGAFTSIMQGNELPAIPFMACVNIGEDL